MSGETRTDEVEATVVTLTGAQLAELVTRVRDETTAGVRLALAAELEHERQAMRETVRREVAAALDVQARVERIPPGRGGAGGYDNAAVRELTAMNLSLLKSMNELRQPQTDPSIQLAVLQLMADRGDRTRTNWEEARELVKDLLPQLDPLVMAVALKLAPEHAKALLDAGSADNEG